jgi:SAM-dependent methyltransferase
LNNYQNFTNSDFDSYYPSFIQKLSKIHWTPIEIIKESIHWVSKFPNIKILDVGSGVGKFCVYGSLLSKHEFTGVEIRKNLVEISNDLANKFSTKRVQFIHSNITEIDFSNYNCIYYYNPFCEQEAISGLIDENLKIGSLELSKYQNHITNQLEFMPKGTLLISYLSPQFQPPTSFIVDQIHENGDLVFWIKK